MEVNNLEKAVDLMKEYESIQIKFKQLNRYRDKYDAYPTLQRAKLKLYPYMDSDAGVSYKFGKSQAQMLAEIMVAQLHDRARTIIKKLVDLGITDVGNLKNSANYFNSM